MDCEPDSPVPTACQDASAPPHDCEGSDCIYGNGVYTDPQEPCSVTDTIHTRCSGVPDSPPAFWPSLQPWFCLSYAEGFQDAEGSNEPFYSRGAGDGVYRYLLQPDTVLLVYPCAPVNYCPTTWWWAIWLTRWFLIGAGGLDGRSWKMFCNTTEFDPEGEADQLVNKPIFLDLDRSTFQPAFIHLIAGDHAPPCFGPFDDVFCFSELCDDPAWECIGGDRARALDSLYVTLNVSCGQDAATFPFANPFEITLRNCAWARINELVDRMDDAHDPRCGYASSRKCTWGHEEVFDENNPTLVALELGPWPAVQGVAPGEDFPAGLYPEYVGEAVPITCRGRLTKVELPAVLTLKMVTLVMHLHVEREGGGDTEYTGYRVFADILVALVLRVKLSPGAFAVDWPLQLRGRPEALDDPFNLEVEDPDHPGQVHPHEFLTPVGPNGERVWLEQTWRGLLSAPEFSRNSNAFLEIAGASNEDCCHGLHAIDRTAIPAEINDCSELQADGSRVIKPQRYRGWVALGVDFSGVPNGTQGGCRG